MTALQRSISREMCLRGTFHSFIYKYAFETKISVNMFYM